MTILALVACAALQAGGTLRVEDRAQLRELLTAVIAETDPNLRRAIAEKGARFGTLGTLAQCVAIVREGPIVPRGAPKPRERLGTLEKLETFGTVASGFSFVHDGRLLCYCVDVPKSYDGTQPVGLLLDPGHGSGAKSDARGKAEFLGMFRRHADAAGLSTWLVARTEILEQIGADGLAGALPDDAVAAAFQAFFRDIATRYAIDCDRIVVNGLSQTGFWTWYLARANPRRFAAILPMSAVTWEVDAYAANLLHVPIGILHGREDPTCPVAQPRATFALLQRLGALDARYVEVPNGKHDYAVWGEEPTLLKSLAAKPRVRYQKLTSFSVQTTLQPWCGPVRVDELEKSGDGRAATAPTGGVDVEIDGQTVAIHSEGVPALTLALSSDEIDLTKPIVLRWNGKPVDAAGALAPSVETVLWVAGETVDWSATREASVRLRAP